MKRQYIVILFFFLFSSSLVHSSYASPSQLEFLGIIDPPRKTFKAPYSLAVDKEGRIAICDNSQETIIFYYPTKETFITPSAENATGESELDDPSSIRLSLNSLLVVADTGNHRIAVFDKTGAFKFSFGGKGSDPGYFRKPEGVAVDSFGRIYVADSGNSRVQIFSKDGIFLRSFGKEGELESDFYRPASVAVYKDEFIYVVDSKRDKVLKFDINGNFLLGIGNSGKNNGEFDYPGAIAVDSEGLLYIVDRENYRIQKFDSEGIFITSIGSKGKGRGQFLSPIDISIDHLNNIYVQDSETHKIQKFMFAKQASAEETKGWMFNPPQKVEGALASVRNGSIVLSWKKSTEPDFNNYIVLRKDNKNNQFQQIFSGTETQLTDTNIQDGLTYYYAIQASDTENLISEKSDQISVAVEISGAIKKAKIAVFTFKEASGKAREAGLGEAAAEFLTTSLVNQGYFMVIEREQLRRILEEQSLSQSGALAAAKKIGDIMGIDIFLLGSITILGDYIEIDSRLIDTVTGSIVTAQNVSSDGFSGLRKAVNEMAGIIKTNYHSHLGTVIGQIPSPPENFQVALTIKNKVYSISKIQPDTGYFSFSGVLAGVYNLEIIAKNFRMDTTKPTTISVVGGKTVNAGAFGFTKKERPVIRLQERHTFKKPTSVEIPTPMTTIAPPTEIMQPGNNTTQSDEPPGEEKPFENETDTSDLPPLEEPIEDNSKETKPEIDMTKNAEPSVQQVITPDQEKTDDFEDSDESAPPKNKERISDEPTIEEEKQIHEEDSLQ